MAFFLDSYVMEATRGLVLLAFMGIGGWTVRSIVRVWRPTRAKSASRLPG